MNKTQADISAIRQGNQALFDAFYLSLRPKFINWAKKQYQKEKEEGIELFQQAMLHTYENILVGKLNELKSSLETYVFGVAKNIENNKIRSISIKQRHQANVSQYYQGLATDHSDDEQQNTLKQLVKQLFPKLKKGCQDLLKCFYFEEKKAKVIAQELGYNNEQVVRTQKSRCVKYLKQLLAEHLQK